MSGALRLPTAPPLAMTATLTACHTEISLIARPAAWALPFTLLPPEPPAPLVAPVPPWALPPCALPPLPLVAPAPPLPEPALPPLPLTLPAPPLATSHASAQRTASCV